MKLINLYKVLTFSILMGVSVSCNNYLDINTDPTRVATAPLSTQLTGVLTATSSAQYSAGNTFSQIVQHMANVAANGQTDTHGEIRLGGTWSTLYLNAMTNASDLLKNAEEQQSPHYAGIAKVLLAFNLGTAADIWGDVPYTQAFNLEKFFYPAFDPQQSIYATIQSLLNAGIADLNQTTSLFKPGSGDDLVHGGNIDKWRRTAQLLRARYSIHLTKKDKNTSVSTALAAIAMALRDNADDFQLNYNAIIVNPWHSVALANNTGNFTIKHSEQLADAMNGTTFGVWDPRLPIIAGARTGVTNTWKGQINGAGTGGTLDLLATTWYSTQTAPILMATFAEQKFIEAEARFLLNGGSATSTGATDATYAAYIAGIDAHMKKLGVPDTARTRYLAAPQVAVGAANLKLSHIMVEKWKALFLNMEAWTDMRRYDYSTNIYKDLSLPTGHQPSLGGQWIRRAEYPLEEFSRNGEQVRKVVKKSTDKVWWDE
jgi:hypothetical protein